MDSYDLFKQLTKGVHFTKKSNSKLNKIKDEKPKDEIKQENKTETFSISNEELNREVDENDEDTFAFVSGVSASTERKNKRKKTKLSEDEKEKLHEQEMIQILRKENQITVVGKNIPPPIRTFEELHTTYNVNESLVNNIIKCNYTKPTPIQMQALPIMLKGYTLMACAPTGSGKTLAFLAPIINDLKAPKKVGFRALVMAPTRELAQQIYRECIRLCEKTALKIHIINKVNQAKQKFGENSGKKFDILVSTPNRVRYLLQQEPPLLDLKSVEWFILDEADRLMEEGQNNFKEQLDDILLACSNPNKKLALFSATYTVPVAKWAIKNLKNLVRLRVGAQNSATDLVDQELLFVGSENGKLLAIRDLVRKGLKPPVLVFVQSKDRAKQLFEELLYDGINVDVIHADRTQQQRDNCVRAFREGHIWVLICTELMSRGIDFKGVNLVINYDFPPSKISYIHRIGRTGRAGRRGHAITFFTQNDTEQLRSIAEIITNSGGTVPEFMLNIKKPSKSERKKYANYAPTREDISTKIKSEIKRKNDKSEEEEKGVNRNNQLKVAKKRKVIEEKSNIKKPNKLRKITVKTFKKEKKNKQY